MHGDRHMCAARACSVVIQMALISPNCTYFVHLSLFVKECSNLFSFYCTQIWKGEAHFVPFNYRLSLVLPRNFENRESLSIQQLLKPFTFRYLDILMGGFANVDNKSQWGPYDHSACLAQGLQLICSSSSNYNFSLLAL